MSANVETMFYVRTAPWHGLGTKVDNVLSSEEAIIKAGLNWNVVQRPILTDTNIPIKGYSANIRDSDNKVLGVVTNRYKIVQNHEAFAFTDDLLGHGVRYETAGSLMEGRKTWLLAKLPSEYIILGDRISPFLVFSNSHDGSGSIKIAMTPIRVVCQNTLNLALTTATRMWTANHTRNISDRLMDAKETLFLAEDYMDKLGNELHKLNNIKVTDEMIDEVVDKLIPLLDNATEQQEKNVRKKRNDLKMRYYYAPDLQHVDNTAYKFINAVSDFATHAKPLRETKSYQENLFAKIIEGNALIDESYRLIKEIA